MENDVIGYVLSWKIGQFGFSGSLKNATIRAVSIIQKAQNMFVAATALMMENRTVCGMYDFDFILKPVLLPKQVFCFFRQPEI